MRWPPIWPNWLAGLLWCSLVLGGPALASPQDVRVLSLDAPGGLAVGLRGHWFVAAAKAPAPAVLLLHGCGGAYGRDGALSERMQEYTAWLLAEGWHVLVLDSLQSRGVRSLCSQPLAERRVSMTQRRRDALGALAWLAQRPEVDARRLALMGWSNGGSAVLAASNLRHPEVAASTVRPAALVTYYPGCEAELKRGFEATAPWLMMVGGADDWTPAAPCRALAAATTPAPQFVAYAGAHHGFDGTAPLRLRSDVPGGVNPGAGVHVGADPAARADSRLRMIHFLRARLAAPTSP